MILFCCEYGHPSATGYQFYAVKLSSCLYVQISMNVTQTMEVVHRRVPTHQDLESVAAYVDTALLVIAERV